MAKNANRVFVKMKSPESGYMYYTLRTGSRPQDA